jgi:hypothetical protein
VSAALVALAALALSPGALPEGTVRYRMEIAGVYVGGAELGIRCARSTCTVTWTTALRLPAEAGGELARARVELEVGPDGRSLGGEARAERDGERRTVAGVAGAVPALIAPLVLLGRNGGGCLAVFEEETGARGEACAGPSSGGLEGVLLDEPLHVTGSKDGFPAVLALPAQHTRWVRASVASPPAHAPRLFGVRVGVRADATRFCGLPPDPLPPPPAPGLPHPAGAGASCREIALDYLHRAARDGRQGRVAVGVAWTGEALAWHAWAEVRQGDAWIPVDPTFGQIPALAPRFTVARYDPHDAAGRLAAGRRVLGCWGGLAR